MDSLNKQNDSTNPNQQSEYSVKEPIVYKSTIIKFALIGLGLIFAIGIVIAGITLYRSIQDSLKPIDPIIPEPTEPTEPVQVKIPIFAYVKDGKSVWQSDINGQDKTRLLELPSSSSDSYSAVAWKTAEDITYSKFTGDMSVIETLNNNNKGILNEINTEKGEVIKMIWGGSNYLAYSTLDNISGSQSFKLKTGTVISTLDTFLTKKENARLNTRVIISEEGGYVIYSGLRIEIKKANGGKEETVEIPFTQVYQFNGAKLDQIDGATDPMLIEKNKIAFQYEGYLSSKYIGEPDITKITELNGFNPTISFDKNKYAYWNSTGGFSNALLVIYDTNLNYQRNVLRGVLLPEWVSSDKVVGIRADNCLGTNCQLYQYQTNNLAIVETSIGKVIEVDQGRSIHSISYNRWYAN